MPVMRQLHIYVSKDMNIRGYFSKPNAVREKKSLDNIGLSW